MLMIRKIWPFALALMTIFMMGSTTKKEVGWMSFEQAMAKSKVEKRKIFIDVYTDWCGWCKRMDANTFSEDRVSAYLSEKFYPVKFNAEQKESVEFNNYTFKYIPRGRGGYNEMAAALLNGQLSYPSVVFLNENFEIIQVLPGYRKADEFLKIAHFIGDDQYLTSKWEDFSKSYDSENSSGD